MHKREPATMTKPAKGWSKPAKGAAGAGAPHVGATKGAGAAHVGKTSGAGTPRVAGKPKGR